MNKQFVNKMLQAKQLQYEAFKEIMPEPMVKKIESLGNELVEIGKEYFMSVSFKCENIHQESNSKTNSNTNTKTDSKNNSKNDSKIKTKSHKVIIE